MVVILVHNAQTGQMQFITEGCDQQQGCALMEQAIRQVRLQTGIQAPVPATPEPPRPRNIREVILPREVTP